MKSTMMISAAVEAVLWYAFAYALLYSIKHDVNLFVASLVVVALAYGAKISCPWFRSTGAWGRMMQD